MGLSNGKQYQLQKAFPAGTFRFEDDRLNQTVLNHIETESHRRVREEEEEEAHYLRRAESARRYSPLSFERMIIGFDDGWHGYLSNDHWCPVTYRGYTYSNAEAAYQAQKNPEQAPWFADPDRKPVGARIKGRAVQLRKDWEEVKVGIMKEILEAKFTQNPELGQKLISTADYYLQNQSTDNDRYWGVNNNISHNMLGYLLMMVRDELITGKTILL